MGGDIGGAPKGLLPGLVPPLLARPLLAPPLAAPASLLMPRRCWLPVVVAAGVSCWPRCSAADAAAGPAAAGPAAAVSGASAAAFDDNFEPKEVHHEGPIRDREDAEDEAFGH
jgi:hypothetical protein